jgi:hypothetical protein
MKRGAYEVYGKGFQVMKQESSYYDIMTKNIRKQAAPLTRDMPVLLCAGHGTVLTGESPARGNLPPM